MNKKERAAFIQKVLDYYFPNPSIPLKHTTAYTLLVATLLSAQCTDKRVNAVTPLLFAKASTPEAMMALSVDQIQTVIRPCGLFHSKAKYIKELSSILVHKYEGRVPDKIKTLEQLPGVGHKTACVVASQAFNQCAFPVDTHIHRCAKRWGLSSGVSVLQTEKDLKLLFPKQAWGTLHLQIIYFGRKYCPARGHITLHCPICRAFLPRGKGSIHPDKIAYFDDEDQKGQR